MRMRGISEKILRTQLALICALAIICGSVVLSQNAEATELPAFFENMTVNYDCSANVKTLDGHTVFNMTARFVDTVIEMNENASIKLVFILIDMSGELPIEVSDFFFPFPLNSQNTTIEVPVAQPMQSHYSTIFLDDGLFTEYKTLGRFLGEENFETRFNTVGTYHMQRVGAFDTYDVFYDKATGWVVYFRETYGGGGEIPNYTVTYSIEMAETNASLSPPLQSAFPYVNLLTIGVILATIVATSIFLLRRKGKPNITAQSQASQS
jgi:hypothetical protein